MVSTQTCEPGTAEQPRELVELRRVAGLLELYSRVSSARAPLYAARIMADDLRDYLGCGQVCVGLCPRHDASCELTAVSGQTRVDPHCERTRLAAAALNESIARAELSNWPPTDPGRRHALLAHRQFAHVENAAAVTSFPLTDDAGHVWGALLVTGELETLQGEACVNFLRAASAPLASTIGLLIRARGNRIDRFMHYAWTELRAKQARAALGMIVATLLLLLLPIHYRVACECELQPVVRRYVAAPFDGRLEANFVQPGDVVSAGQLLARIDARDIHWELSGKQAELHRVEKQLAGHIAMHESGQAGITRLEAQRLRLRIEQLEDHTANLEIRSPIAGMVVLGDLSKSEGIPLEQGQTLYEIAPLDKIAIEVAVPEDDVRFVEPGMRTEVSLDAFPLQRWQGELERIHPRAELKDHENVFVAELNIENPSDKLRPGMRGKAKITTVRRCLGWVLFHQAFAAMLTWMGW